MPTGLTPRYAVLYTLACRAPLAVHKFCFMPCPPSSCCLRLFRPVLRSTRDSIRNTTLSNWLVENHIPCPSSNAYHIHRPPYQMIPHTRTILRPTTSHKHYAVLRYIVPYKSPIISRHQTALPPARFPRSVSPHHLRLPRYLLLLHSPFPCLHPSSSASIHFPTNRNLAYLPPGYNT